MTFIATVVAKKGAALIADSLITSSAAILPFRKFINYVNTQPKNEQGETIITTDGISQLFSREPIHTKDYEEKLFKLNHFTGITCTGIAYINEISIADLVEIFKSQQQDIGDMAIPFAEKLQQFISFITSQIKEHLGKFERIGECTFIVTFYEKHTHKTYIHKVNINEANKETLGQEDYNYVTSSLEPEWAKVVCDGQNKLSDKILYGIGKYLYGVFPDMVKEIINRLNLPEGTPIPENFIKTLMDDDFFKEIFFEDIEMLNISDLSVQQAVDLASLLMRLEVDFQKYTKNIPTVGGVIKLAKIDENGFDFISGDKIEAPKHIHL